VLTFVYANQGEILFQHRARSAQHPLRVHGLLLARRQPLLDGDKNIAQESVAFYILIFRH
jgi:hypothetical protein